MSYLKTNTNLPQPLILKRLQKLGGPLCLSIRLRLVLQFCLQLLRQLYIRYIQKKSVPKPPAFKKTRNELVPSPNLLADTENSRTAVAAGFTVLAAGVGG